MSAVDRKFFVKHADFAYSDAPQQLGGGMSVSAPHLHASCLQVLATRLRPGAKALDIGCGSGYVTAAMAHMGNPALDP